MKVRSNLLLDTHILLWWLAGSSRLSRKLAARIGAGGPSIVVSPASVWEIEIKRAAGKLSCPDDLEEQLSAGAFTVLPITIHHAVLAGRLPMHHRDPFDRLLIAQAQAEGLALATADARFNVYDVERVSA